MGTVIRLDTSQEQALCNLQRRLVAHAHNEASKVSDTIAQCGYIHELGMANVFGLLGARGSGKSTLLNILYSNSQKVSSEQLCSKYADIDLSHIVLIPPMDCSVLPQGITPGTAVLLRLREHLSNISGKSVEDYTCLNKVIGLCSRTDKGYRDLYLDLSTTPDDYSQFLTKGLSERLELSQELATCLKDELEKLNRDVFVVLLDDFDLVYGDDVHRWLKSLLDELHQSKLLFVLTGDLHRLEHLSWDDKTKLDEETGRALIHKLIPSQNRTVLPQWEPTSRLKFKPSKDASNTLGELLDELIHIDETSRRLVHALLPFWPRGLNNLYQSLKDAQTTRTDEKNSATSLYKFLRLLAICREEHLLARHLDETKPRQWSTLLPFSDSKLPTEAWEDLVENACTRVQEGPTAAPLRSLNPAEIPKRTETERPSLADLMTVFETEWGSHDPLRHERLHRLPLGDAVEQDTPLWIELLVDLSFEQMPRSRLQFLESWQPAQRRLQNSRLQIATSRRTLREQLENYGILSNRAALYWLTRGGDAEGDIMVGWQPLLQALRGARDPFSFDLLHNLNTDASTLDGDLPQGKSTPDIIPKKLWGCILLTDGLNRCPWAAFSTPLGLHITTNLGLAAAFIRSAYLYALHRADQLPIDVISEIQKTFLEPLIKGDPGKLLCLEEEELVHRLVLLFTDDTQEMVKQRDDPLSVAFNAYLTSPVYTSVVSLINILASAWNIPLNNKEA